MNQAATFNTCICNLTPEVRDIYLKYFGKEEKLLLFMFKLGPDFHFEISDYSR